MHETSIQEIIEQIRASPVPPIVVGGILLIYGRRLYWLALGGVGFAIGLFLAERYLAFSSMVELGVAFLAGVLGAVVAVVAQKIAVTLGGFFLGAYLAYMLAQPWAAELEYQIWWVAVLGAVLGVCFAAFLFDAALIVVSSLVGAGLVVRAIELEPLHQTWAYLGLMIFGVMLQSRERARRPPDDD